MFRFRNGKRITKAQQTDGNIPYITGGSKNNGITEYIGNPAFTESNIITFNFFGEVYYQQDEVGFKDGTYSMTLLDSVYMNKGVSLYVVTLLSNIFKQIPNGYDMWITPTRVEKIEIPLPVLTPEDTEPYWDYMAYDIYQIQQQYADKLEEKSEYELNLMCQILGVTRDDIEQRVELTQPQYTNTFKVGELFGVTGTKSTNAGTLEFKDCGVEFIGRTSVNNGVQGYIDELEYAPNEDGTITVSQVGTIVAQYRGMPYYTSQNIAKLEYKRKLSKEEGLYFVTCINKHLQLYGGYQTPKLDDIKNIILELPVIAPNSKQIDWNAISLGTVGGGDQLSGYSYGDMQQRSCDNQTVDSVNLPQPIYKEFRLKGLFTSVKRGTRLVTTDRVPGNTPLITAGETNQGVSQYISHNTELFPANSLTIDMFGNVFYRSYEFFADDNIIVLNNSKLTRRVLNYIQGNLFWLVSNYSYAKQFRLKELDSLTLKLPVHTLDDTIPNWGYMDEYIQEIELNYLVKQAVQEQRTIKQIRQMVS